MLLKWGLQQIYKKGREIKTWQLLIKKLTKAEHTKSYAARKANLVNNNKFFHPAFYAAIFDSARVHSVSKG